MEEILEQKDVLPSILGFEGTTLRAFVSINGLRRVKVNTLEYLFVREAIPQHKRR
jgi:hypothetical protein